MDIEKRLQALEDYCFKQNTAFQQNVWENVLLKLESPDGLGIGKRLFKDEPFLIKLTALNKGFRLPLMTQAQRNAIVDPGALNVEAYIGLMIYQIDEKPGIRTYNGTHWVSYTENNDD